jgi:hypothetical protein
MKRFTLEPLYLEICKSLFDFLGFHSSEFALGLRKNSGLLNSSGTIKTMGTHADELNPFSIVRRT